MPAKDDFLSATSMAEWLGLKDEEASDFVDKAMERRGHKKVSSWADNDEGGDKKGKGFLDGLGGKSSANWQYSGGS